jgi:LMBR1 domain-containing protein 1
LLTLFSVGFVNYYASKRESQVLVTSASIATISIVLWTIALLPIDIFLVSSTVDKSTGLKKLWADDETVYWMTLTVQIVYYGNKTKFTVSCY